MCRCQAINQWLDSCIVTFMVIRVDDAIMNSYKIRAVNYLTLVLVDKHT